MNRLLLLVHPVFVLLAGAICTNAALADSTDVADPTIPDILRNFRFITSHSTVEQSGGLPLYTIDWNVAGKFGLATGDDGLLTPTPTPTTTISGHASFVNVNAYMFHPQSAGPASAIALDLDSVLNLSGLKGLFKVPSDIHFTGDDGQGIPIELEAVTVGPLMRITGGTLPVPTCASCGINTYKVDAFAAVAPYADFNLDGVIDGADFSIWRANMGMETAASFEQGDANGDGIVDGADYVIWRHTLGSATSLGAFASSGIGESGVPEPTTIVMLLIAVAMTCLLRRRTT